MAKQFIWLMDNQTPRSGPELKKNGIHNVSDYSVETVAWWVAQGAAAYTGEKPKKSKDGGN